MEKQLTKVKEEIRRETGLTSPLDLQAHLDDLAAGIFFVHGSGKRKSGEQRVWEKLHTLLERWQSMRDSCPQWERGATAIPRQTRTPPLCG